MCVRFLVFISRLLSEMFGRVCLCAGSTCIPPLVAPVYGVAVCALVWISAASRKSWLGCCGVFFSVCALPIPRHSWLGCAVWVVVVGFAFRPRPTFPSCGVGVCVFVCTLPP